jgi:hypothetical protein
MNSSLSRYLPYCEISVRLRCSVLCQN